MNKPNIIVCDFDGVLTDGRLHITSDGEKLFKSLHTRDIRAIRELVSIGYEFYIVSADDWSGGKVFAEKVGAEFICLRDKSTITQYIGDKPFIAIGDDSWDIPMLKLAEYSFCPVDAYDQVLLVKDILVLKSKGGSGCIAELLDKINYTP